MTESWSGRVGLKFGSATYSLEFKVKNYMGEQNIDYIIQK